MSITTRPELRRLTNSTEEYEISIGQETMNVKLVILQDVERSLARLFKTSEQGDGNILALAYGEEASEPKKSQGKKLVALTMDTSTLLIAVSSEAEWSKKELTSKIINNPVFEFLQKNPQMELVSIQDPELVRAFFNKFLHLDIGTVIDIGQRVKNTKKVGGFRKLTREEIVQKMTATSQAIAPPVGDSSRKKKEKEIDGAELMLEIALTSYFSAFYAKKLHKLLQREGDDV